MGGFCPFRGTPLIPISEAHAPTHAEHGYHILVRVLRRMDQQLHIRRNREDLQQLKPIEEFRRVLVVQPGTECRLRRSAPVQAQADQVALFADVIAQA